MSRGLCAYAITRDHMLDPAGPAEIRLVRHRGLALVVAEADLAPFAALAANPEQWAKEPRENDPLVILARRHDVVVRAIFERHPVLPLCFGTTLPDEPAAVRLLTAHHDEAMAWLNRVEGHREWVVRARLAPPAKPAEAPAEDLSGTEYLTLRRSRLAAAAHERRESLTAAAALDEALTRQATETVHRPRKSATPLLDAAYLVRVSAEPGFHAETKRHHELAVEVNGPWPPYSFVKLDLTLVATCSLSDTPRITS